MDRIIFAQLYVILISIFILGCKNDVDQKISQTDDYKLLEFESKFKFETGENIVEYSKDRKKFIKPYTSVEFLGDTIKATTIFLVNSCTFLEGEIRQENNKLILEINESGREKCASEEFYEVNYTILNKSKREPIIVF